MNVSVRPQTKLFAALMAAGVVAAGSAMTEPARDPLPVGHTIAVAPASFVTDALYGLGTVVDAATSAVTVTTDMLISLPFNAVDGAAAALQNPGEIATVLSYLAQRYLNPAEPSFSSYPYRFTFEVLAPLLSLLPAPLDVAAINALEGAAIGIGNAFAVWPATEAAQILVLQFGLLNPVGRLLVVASNVLHAPFAVAEDLVDWVGYLPGELEATVESAIRSPGDIPGLLSNLVNSALNPGYGLLGRLLSDVASPTFFLPPPIGLTVGPNINVIDYGLAYSAYTQLGLAISNFLSTVLPTPVTPKPFALQAATIQSSAIGVTSVVAPPTSTPTAFSSDDEGVDGVQAPALLAGRAGLNGELKSGVEGAKEVVEQPVPEPALEAAGEGVVVPEVVFDPQLPGVAQPKPSVPGESQLDSGLDAAADAVRGVTAKLGKGFGLDKVAKGVGLGKVTKLFRHDASGKSGLRGAATERQVDKADDSGPAGDQTEPTGAEHTPSKPRVSQR